MALDAFFVAAHHALMYALSLLSLLAMVVVSETSQDGDPKKGSEPKKDSEPKFTKTTYTYKTAGDLAIQADVYRPKNDLVLPVIFWIHGGALIGGHRGNLGAEQAKRYVESGFVVVSIDYRLAPETKLAAILEDVDDARRSSSRRNRFGAGTQSARSMRLRAETTWARPALLSHRNPVFLVSIECRRSTILEFAASYRSNKTFTDEALPGDRYTRCVAFWKSSARAW